jgi:chemotaxis protein CheD
MPSRRSSAHRVPHIDLSRGARPVPHPVPRPATQPAPQPAPPAAVYLQPGEVHASGAPTVITTILGSCVAVCLFDLERGVGGMNHYLLAQPVRRERSTRFGSVAIEALFARLAELGAPARGLRAKVFGGAAVLGSRSGRTLGDDNVALAVATLEAHSVPIVAGDTGGTRGRKLVFHTHGGDAFVREL